MLTKTFIGAATAITIAVGSLAATTSTASASGYGYGYVSGPNWQFQYQPRPKKICKPVFRTVKWRDYYGHPHWKKIQVGYKCEWVYPKHRRHHQGGNWNPAY
jgi:hypothetical protein